MKGFFGFVLTSLLVLALVGAGRGDDHGTSGVRTSGEPEDVAEKGTEWFTTWAPQGRTVRYEYRVINPTGEAATDIDVFVPLPLETPRQEIHYLHLPNAPKARLFTDRHGQSLVHYAIERLGPGEWLELGYVVGITLRNMRWNVENVEGHEAVALTAEQRELYLRAATNYSMDSDLMRSTAATLVEGATTEFEKLERIHDHVVSSIRYVRDSQWDTAETVLARGTGSCSEYNYVLTGLCRLAGLPTRCTGGTSNSFRDMPTTDTVFHRWTEVFLSDYGWFPVDCSRDANPIRGKRSHFGRVYADAMVWCHQAGGKDDTLGWDYRGHAHVRGENPGIRENHRVRWFESYPEESVEAAYDWIKDGGSVPPELDLLECGLLRWDEVGAEAKQRAIRSLAAAGSTEALRRAATLPTVDGGREASFRRLCRSPELADVFLKESQDLWGFRNWFKGREARLTAVEDGRFQMAESGGSSRTTLLEASSGIIWAELASEGAARLSSGIEGSNGVSMVVMPPVDQTEAGLGDQGRAILATIKEGLSRRSKIRVIDEASFDRWMAEEGPGRGEYWIFAHGDSRPPADLSPDVIVVPVCVVDEGQDTVRYRLDLKTLRVADRKYTTTTARARTPAGNSR